MSRKLLISLGGFGFPVKSVYNKSTFLFFSSLLFADILSNLPLLALYLSLYKRLSSAKPGKSYTVLDRWILSPTPTPTPTPAFAVLFKLDEQSFVFILISEIDCLPFTILS